VTTDLSHLTAAAAQLLAESNANRIRAVLAERWVHYPRASQVLQILNRLVDHPRTTRMPSIAIYGDSGMGKTMIMEKFRREHPPLFDGDAGVERSRVLALQMAGKPGERRLYAQILTALGAPQNPRATVVDLEQVALRLLRAVDLQVLVLDEVHNILAGTFREQRVVLNTLRYLSNELKLSLVCFGVNEAREAISGDVQLARRFEEFPLPRWSADDGFEQLVRAIIRNLPLRQATVLTARAARRILQSTDGLTAKVFRMLNELAVEAIETGAERITDEAIERWHPATNHETSFA
jgi:Bacterial TniB protein